MKTGKVLGVKVHDEEGQANYLGSESGAGVGNGVGEALTEGMCRLGYEPRNQALLGCRRALHTRKATLARPGGVEDPRHAQRHFARESGDPPSGPGSCWGPHGEPKEYDCEGHTWAVGQPHRIGEAPIQRCWCARGAEGVEKRGLAKGNTIEHTGGRTQGRALLSQALDRVRQALPGACASKTGARSGSAARRDLCEGCRVTGIPTATCKNRP
jgi:hypothetical protein